MKRDCSQVTDGGPGRQIRRLWQDEEALTTVEYALLFALMVGAVVLAYQHLGWFTAESVRDSDSALPEPSSGAENPNSGISGPT